jgi:dihydrofolate synthase/folylpolyglutamate synthase
LHKAGYRVGCFTSPHLHTLNERFAVNSEPCPNDRLVEIVQHLESQWYSWSDTHPVMGDGDTQRELTFFEYSVLVAFEYFSREKVDFAIIETGLGGRFDATNICEPILSVITSISFEHTEQLGNTLSAITGEKAGIIKPGVPVVSGVAFNDGDDPQTVIREVATQNHSPLYEYHRDFSIVSHDNGSFDFHWHHINAYTLDHLQLSLLGRHQQDNAAITLASIMLLRERGWNISDEAIRVALAELAVPCRVERLKLPDGPTVIVDGAHNKASAAALLEAVQTFLVCEKTLTCRKILLFGSTLGKDVPGMFEVLLPFFDEVWFSQCSTSPRAVPVDMLLELAQKTANQPQNITVMSTPQEAADCLQQTTGENDFICVTGSLYFAAEIREQLLRPIP